MPSINSCYAILLLVLLGLSCQSGAESPSILIQGATIFDGHGNSIQNGQILIEEGIIKYVGKGDYQPVESKNVQNIDATGKYIMPGLIDAHVHLTLSGFYDTRPEYVNMTDVFPYHEVMAKRKEMVGTYLDSYLKSGVTSVYDLGSESWTLDLQHNDSFDSPHVSAVGPLITHYEDPGIIDKVFINPKSPADAKLIAATLSAQGSTGIKCWRLDWDNKEFIEHIEVLFKEAVRYDNHLIFHIESSKEVEKVLQLAGEKIITHLPHDKAIDQKLIQKMVDDKVMVIPTLIVHSGYVRTLRGLLGQPFVIKNPQGLIDEYTWEMVHDLKQYESIIDTAAVREMLTYWTEIESEQHAKIKYKNMKALYDAGVLIAVGSDAGNPSIFHGPAIYEELEAMQDAGIIPLHLITMATKNGAIAMKKNDTLGTLEAGKVADLIILDEDPSLDISNIRTISGVMKKGQFVRRR